MATREDALRLCEYIENICPKYGYHVALTGGCLYGGRASGMFEGSDDDRKDIDIIFYRIRQEKNPRRDKLLQTLEDTLNIELVSTHGWMNKAKIGPHDIDILFPDYVGESQYVKAGDTTNGY